MDYFIPLITPQNTYLLIRVRPESYSEQQDSRWRTVIRVLDERVLIFDPNNATPRTSRGSVARAFTARSKEMRYSFDRVFDQFANQQDIYESTTKGLIPFVTNGFNATVFAYGATGLFSAALKQYDRNHSLCIA